MATSDISLMGAVYPDVPQVVLPKNGGGTTTFTDVSDTTATASDVLNSKYFYNANGERTQGTATGGGGDSETVVNAGGGYSLDSNNALKTIEDFEYATGLDNPWIEEENPTDYENYGIYLDNKIDSIPSGNSFIFITDVHYTTNKKRSGALIDYVRRKAGIKTVIHGGDVQNERPLAIDAAKDWIAFNRDYAGRIGSDFKQVCGDHDHNGTYWDNQSLRSQYNLSDASDTVFTCKFVQKVLSGYYENEVTFNDTHDDDVAENEWSSGDMAEYEAFKKMQYYFDDHHAKIRFIVLFTGWNAYDVGFPCSKCGRYGVIPTQMDFLHGALMGTPENYNVVVCGHDTVISKYKETVSNVQYYDTTTTEYNSAQWQDVSKMLAALRTKGTASGVGVSDWSATYSSTASVPTKNFSFDNAPDVGIVMSIGGDVHWDINSKTTTQSTTLSTLGKTAVIDKDTDIPHIVTMTDGSDRGYCDYTTRDPICDPATAGTIDEQAFDVVTLNDDGIFITRFGSGSDRVLSFAEIEPSPDPDPDPDDHSLVPATFIPNEYVNNQNGICYPYNGWSRTDFVDISMCASITARTSVASGYNAFYDANYDYISGFMIRTYDTQPEIPSNAKYIIMSNTDQGMEDLVATYVPKS